MKNAKYLGALALLLVACSGGKTTGGTGASTAEEKKAAAEAANGSSSSGSDVCAEKAWYGDGVCDSFCADHDADCVPDGTQVVCAEFIEESNGVCERADDDPCKFQDPDCGDSVPPSAGGGDGSGGGVVCAMFVGVSDGSGLRAGRRRDRRLEQQRRLEQHRGWHRHRRQRSGGLSGDRRATERQVRATRVGPLPFDRPGLQRGLRRVHRAVGRCLQPRSQRSVHFSGPRLQREVKPSADSLMMGERS